MNKYFHRGGGEVVIPTERFGRADHWNTDSEDEHHQVEEAFHNHIESLPVLAYCSPSLPIGFLEGVEERYQVLEPVPPCGDLEWVTRGKEEYDKCSAPIMESICEVCGGEYAIHNNMNQACPKDKNAKRSHTEYRQTSVFTYHHACCRLFLVPVSAEKPAEEKKDAMQTVLGILVESVHAQYDSHASEKVGGYQFRLLGLEDAAEEIVKHFDLD